MKKKIILTTLSITLAAGMSAGALLCFGKEMLKVEASSYSVNSIPTTIDLNDTTPANIRSYYSSLNSLTTSERQGTNLLKNLKPILKNGQKYYSYGSSATTAVWQAYEIVDRDWDKSPASSISGYNSTTNKITGYTYGTSNSNVGSNPYIHALYVNRKNVVNQTRAWGNHNQDQWGINQEHVWAKSCGFNDNSPAAGARGDLMHLWAGNGKVNGTYHSNYYYGYVDTSKSYNDASEYASTLSGNRKGYSKTLGGTYTVFEPQDSDKGDIARALFYMAARYNYLSGSDSDGIDAGNPNLEIVNVLNWAPGSSYQSSTSKKGQMGILQDLLEWNRLDPPDAWEIHRNNLLYNNYTKNRNPFIDFPEWAEYIWGKSEDGSYNSSSTGFATPSSDTINDFGEGTTPVEKTLSSISISGQKTSFLVGSTFSFGGTVTAHYSDDSTADVTASSTFSGYNMHTAGNYTVTVSYTESAVTKTATYQISVSDGSTPITDGDASLYSGTLTEGDYVIYYGGKAMKNTVSSNRLSYEEVTVSNDTVSSPSSDIIWHIAQSGDYWTIFNSAVAKYAAGTGADNKATVTTTNDDYAKWTASGTSTYEFVNKGNATASKNANLRNNGTYGFACYSISTGGALSLYKISSTQPAVPTSITASVDQTYYVGDTISKDDITVIDNNDNVIADFSFADDNHQFTYEDASSGGNLTDKTFTNSITYSGLTCSLTVQVQRKAYVQPDDIEYVIDDFSSVPAGYKNVQTNIFELDGFTITATGSYRYDNYLSLSYQKSGSNRYCAETVTSSRTPYEIKYAGVALITDVTDPLIEYSADNSNWSTTNSGGMYYFRVSYPEAWSDTSKYINITNIDIILAGPDNALNLSNFIMYEDTVGQCTTKTDSAISIFNNMTSDERSTFMTSDDFVISTARDRLDKWLINQGKEISISNGDYVVTTKNSVASYSQENNHIYLIIAISGVISISILGFYFLLKKKKSS